MACRKAYEAKGVEPPLANVAGGRRSRLWPWRPRMAALPTGMVTFLFTGIEGPRAFSNIWGTGTQTSWPRTGSSSIPQFRNGAVKS